MRNCLAALCTVAIVATLAPKVSSAGGPSPLLICGFADGRIYFRESKVTLQELSNQLSSLTEPERSNVVIVYDLEGQHQGVIALMQATKDAKLERVGFKTLDERDPKEWCNRWR